MQSSIFFALLFLAATAAAQTPAEQIKRLQNDPNIIWIGEAYLDYEDLDGTYEGRNIDKFRPDTLPDGSIKHQHPQATAILKMERREASLTYWTHYFWEEIISPKTKIFADADLTKPISYRDKKNYIRVQDTIETFDPETFRTMSKIVLDEVNPRLIYAYRLRQLVYYNAKENMYYNLPLSIAPMYTRVNEHGEPLGLKALFWLPVIASPTPINPSKSADMSFIKSVQMDMFFADMKPLKETTKIAEVNQIWCGRVLEQKNEIFAVGTLGISDSEQKTPLSSQDIQDIFIGRDTIIEADTLKGISTEINRNISALRFNQTFGWDEQKKTLTVATYSVAPIMERYDYNKNLIYRGPLFYLYPHRRFKAAAK